MPSLLDNLRFLQENEDRLAQFPSEPLLRVCKEVAKLTGLLGTALKFAASDVTSKIDIVEGHIEELKNSLELLTEPDGSEAGAGGVAAAESEAGPSAAADGESEGGAEGGAAPVGKPPLGYSLRDIILSEIAENRADNRKYPSVSRTLMRLVWFLDFTEALTSNLVNPELQELELRECSSRAYDDRLSRHHTWFVRKAVGAGMYACPLRITFYTNCGGGNPEGAEEQLRDVGLLLRRPVEVLWEFYRANGIDALP